MPKDRIKLWDKGAVGKLERRLAELRTEYTKAKTVNKIRRNKSMAEDDKIQRIRQTMGGAITWREAMDLADRGFTRTEMQRMATDVSYYQRRLDWAHENQAKPYREKEVVDGVYAFRDPETWRIGFIFDEPPTEEMCAYLTSKGFRYAPSKGRWQRILVETARPAMKAAETKIRRDYA